VKDIPKETLLALSRGTRGLDALKSKARLHCPGFQGKEETKSYKYIIWTLKGNLKYSDVGGKEASN